MRQVNIKKLLNMHLATTVKEAMEAGELNGFNIYQWCMERNMGIEDVTLINEVYALVNYYMYH